MRKRDRAILEEFAPELLRQVDEAQAEMPALAEKIKAAEQHLAELRRQQGAFAEKRPKKEPRARGEGSVYQTSYRDRRTGEKILTPNYYIRYRLPSGKRVREALETTSRDEAARTLRKRLEDRDAGRPTGPQIDKTTLGEVLVGLLTDYTTNGRKSIKRVEDSCEHLKDFLGEHAKARTVDEVRIGEYVAHRQKEGAANGTINRELTALKRGFRLAHRSFRVGRVPYIAMLKEAAARSGFVEREQHEAILAAMPAPLRPVLEVAYVTGWRVASEVLTREWRHVDFGPERWPCACKGPTGQPIMRTAPSCADCGEVRPGWLRLDPGETKNGQPRTFPLTPELRSVLEAQRAATDAVEKATETIVPLVFHRKGRKIVSFRRAWQTTVEKVGLPNLIPHDYRRSAVRSLERAGVPRSTAMALVGHKTASIYSRYAITDEGMLREGAAKLAAFAETAKTATRKIVPIEQAKKAKARR